MCFWLLDFTNEMSMDFVDEEYNEPTIIIIPEDPSDDEDAPPEEPNSEPEIEQI